MELKTFTLYSMVIILMFCLVSQAYFHDREYRHELNGIHQSMKTQNATLKALSKRDFIIADVLSHSNIKIAKLSHELTGTYNNRIIETERQLHNILFVDPVPLSKYKMKKG